MLWGRLLPAVKGKPSHNVWTARELAMLGATEAIDGIAAPLLVPGSSIGRGFYYKLVTNEDRLSWLMRRREHLMVVHFDRLEQENTQLHLSLLHPHFGGAEMPPGARRNEGPMFARWRAAVHGENRRPVLIFPTSSISDIFSPSTLSLSP